jgi:hypothetical protein
MGDILKPKKQYKKRQTKQEIIDEYKGGFIDEPVYNDPTSVDELVEEEEKKQFPKTDEELLKHVPEEQKQRYIRVEI